MSCIIEYRLAAAAAACLAHDAALQHGEGIGETTAAAAAAPVGVRRGAAVGVSLDAGRRRGTHSKRSSTTSCNSVG
ncbi:unnamed protein product [Merluccius merluccius]